MRNRVVAFVMIVSAVLAARAQDGPSIAQLVGWMSGSFSSAEQAAADSTYFDIRLEMARIWPERADGPWLYVEQAVASSLDRPYRQRVYHVTEPEPGLFVSEVFELPGDPQRFAGAWRADSLLAGVTPEQLVSRTGCAVHLRWVPDRDTYEGRTPGEACLSSLRGATYATSEVSLSSGGIVSWDRGWDDQGRHVWGAEKGGYVFRRVDR